MDNSYFTKITNTTYFCRWVGGLLTISYCP